MEAVQPDGYPWELLILLFVTLGITRKGRKMLRNTFYQSNSIMDGSWVHEGRNQCGNTTWKTSEKQKLNKAFAKVGTSICSISLN